MKIKQKVGISGRVDIEKYNTRTGELVEKREGKNMLLNSYLNGYFEEGYPLLSSDVFSACMLGDSNTAVARTQTGVQGSTLASKASKAVDTSLIALMNRGWDTKNTFTGHGGDVYSVNFHPDPNSNLAISGSYDDTAKIFEYDTTAGTTTEMATFTGHNTRVYSANFHPDPNSNLAISGSWDNTVKIFEYDTTAGTTTEVATFTGHNSYVSSVNFHPDPNSNLAISGSWDNTVKIFEYDTTAGTTTEVATFTGHGSDINSVNFHPDPNSNLAISGSYDETAKIFEYDTTAGTTTEVATFTGHGGDVYSVNFHPDPNSNLAISGSYDDTAKIFEYDTTAGTTTEMATFTGHNTRVYSANFHPDPNSNLAISGSWDNTVKIFEYDTTAGTTTEVATFTGHNSYVSSVNFHPDPNSNLAISGSWDNTVKIFEILTDKKNTISANGEWVFEAGEGTGTIREIFLQADFSGYPLYGSDTPVARKVISPEIVKDEYHEIILKWTIEITKPDLGWSGTLSDVGMSGENISYELTLGNQSLAQNTGFIKPLSWNINQNNTADVFLRTFEMNTEPTSIEATKLTGDYYETQIDRVSTYQILKTYTASQYKIEYRVTLDVDDSNTANIGGLRLENDGTESSLRVLFDPKLPKTDTYRLHFDFEYQLNPN